MDTHIERGLSCNHRGVAFAFVMAWPWGRGVAKLACGGDDDGDHDSTLIGSLMSHTRRREKKGKEAASLSILIFFPFCVYMTETRTLSILIFFPFLRIYDRDTHKVCVHVRTTYQSLHAKTLVIV
jgi:hypothetical protein